MNFRMEMKNMAYVKRVPPIKLILTKNEYNTLIGVLTKNIDEDTNDNIKELATLTKEKLLKYSIPHEQEENLTEIDIRLYLNEAADIISQLLSNISKTLKEVDYYQVLLKARENMETKENK